MFIKVTRHTGDTLLVNTDHIYCVAEHRGEVKVVYTDDEYLLINESIDEIERMLKGVDNE